MKQNYQEVVTTAPYAFFILDEQFVILELNDAAQKLLGLPQEDIENKNLGSFVHQDSREKFTECTSDVPLANSLNLELKLRVGNGSSPWVRMSIHRRLDEKGNQYLIWVDNISETQALREQSIDQNSPLKKFLHDIGNVLARGSGYVELLSMQTKSDSILSGDKLDLVKKYVEKIRESIGRTGNLIQEARWQESKPDDTNKNKNILIIDDEPTVAILLAELMSREKHNVQMFHDSEEALIYFEKNSRSIDLVISDQFMPKISGIQLATEMLTVRKDLPIVLCTGDSQTIEKQSDGSFNIKYFISKPIDIDEIKNLVRKIFDDVSKPESI